MQAKTDFRWEALPFSPLPALWRILIGMPGKSEIMALRGAVPPTVSSKESAAPVILAPEDGPAGQARG